MATPPSRAPGRKQTQARNKPGPQPAAAPVDEPAVRVLRQFRQVFNAVKTHFQQVEKKVGLGGAQVWALSVIKEQPGIGVGGLAEAMNIHQSTASNLVRILLERELVCASRHAVDRRAVQLKLLPAGNRLLRKSPGPFSGVLPNALAALDAKTLKRLEADLDKVIEQLNVDDAAGGIPLAEL